jgi:two-component system, chemotaxis family, chemotaxis protein CheY
VKHDLPENEPASRDHALTEINDRYREQTAAVRSVTAGLFVSICTDGEINAVAQPQAHGLLEIVPNTAHAENFDGHAPIIKEARKVRTCLVVDDSSVVRKIARRILEAMDFEIIEAEDGEQALEVCKCAMPEAVLLDWNMPVMDGYEFLGNLRRLPGGDMPKVVFCTTENGIDHISRALRAGANEYIMKPFDKDIIAAKFQEVGLVALPLPTVP